MSKTINNISSIAVTVTGALMVADWSWLPPTTAGWIVFGLGLVKSIANNVPALTKN